MVDWARVERRERRSERGEGLCQGGGRRGPLRQPFQSGLERRRGGARAGRKHEVLGPDEARPIEFGGARQVVAVPLGGVAQAVTEEAWARAVDLPVPKRTVPSGVQAGSARHLVAAGALRVLHLSSFEYCAVRAGDPDVLRLEREPVAFSLALQ